MEEVRRRSDPDRRESVKANALPSDSNPRPALPKDTCRQIYHPLPDDSLGQKIEDYLDSAQEHLPKNSPGQDLFSFRSGVLNGMRFGR